MTLTGVDASLVVPLPSWPELLRPQHLAPIPTVAHTLYWPPAMLVAPVRFDTDTGVLERVVVPLPSWPKLFCPQHFTVPSASRAQLELK
jgi:hypothetical protein